MSTPLLLKGFEVELFTGRDDGSHVGVAAEVAQELPDFVTEPDHRNLEYITAPTSSYAEYTGDLQTTTTFTACFWFRQTKSTYYFSCC